MFFAGRGSWNYCNLALFSYGGMKFNDYVSIGNNSGYFKQSTWPLGKGDADWQKVCLTEQMESIIVVGLMTDQIDC